MAKIGRNDLCPCGSGKKYKRCCYGKRFDWVVDGSGIVRQRFPINDEMESVLESQRELSRKHFEREPGSGDPIFIQKYLYSDEDHQRIMVEAMRKAGIDEDKIYAYKQAGRLIFDSHLQNTTGAAIAEWDDAIEEFHAQGGDPVEKTKGHQFDLSVAEVNEEIESLIFLYGFILDKYLNTDLIEDGAGESIMSPLQYAGLCMARTHRTMRSVKTLIEGHMDDDALSLTRSVYENYLHIVYVANNPSRVADLVDAVIGLQRGTHAYERAGEKINKRVIVDVRTRKKYLGHISAYKMAECSSIKSDLEFFDHFYRKSSEILHPSVLRLDSYITDKGLDPLYSKMHEEAVFYAVLVGAMPAQVIKGFPRCPESLRMDIDTVITRISAKLGAVLDILEMWQNRIGEERLELAILRNRSEDLTATANHAMQPTGYAGG